MGGGTVSPEDDSSGRRIKLLVVDDETGHVEVLPKRMARRQIEVRPVPTGSETIQALRKQDFDVAGVDLKMEDMDGLEILKIFKKRTRNCRSSCSPVTALNSRRETD